MTGRWRRILGGVLLIGCGFVVLVGPWPASDADLTGGIPFRDTLRRLDRISPAASRGPLRAGVAEVDITPPAPLQPAGFLDQIWEPSVGVNSRCFARALTVAGASSSVTILTADLLLIDAGLARRVLLRSGLPRDQIYFTATHTHGGPGGWGNHPLERMVAGTFDPEWVDELADRLARAVTLSRGNLRPVEVAFVAADLPGMQTNRIIPSGPTNDTLSAWIFRTVGVDGGPGPALATLASFGAHATLGHPKPARIGADYPGAFAEALRRNPAAGTVLFAAGAVGDAAPVRPKGGGQAGWARDYGVALAEGLGKALRSAEFRRETDLANLHLAVDLPPVRVPFRLGSLRFSPLATWWIARPRTELHILRLGPATLAGFPGDVASHLASRLAAEGPVVATSFNGDYKGYLVTRETFRDHPGYETRVLSFFGPGAGEYLTDVAQAMIGKVQGVLR